LLELALEPLKSKLTRAFIYGSVAKQTDSSASDIDLMLIGKSLTLSKIFHCLQALEESLRRKINPTCLTPQEFELRCQDPDSFVSKVLSQPVIELFTSSHGN
jgi:predicted nucleotidyltransferase